jgi:hypothetical protein
MLAANTVTLAFYWGRTFTDVALLTGLELWNFILDFFDNDILQAGILWVPV